MDTAITSRPTVYRYGDAEISKLRETGAVLREMSVYEACGEEYFEITNPTIKPGQPGFAENLQEFMSHWMSESQQQQNSCLVFFPWIGTLVQVPNRDIYRALRSSRNRNLITTEEQQTLHAKRIGIAGLSVGSNILSVLALTGVGGSYAIADMDTLSLPNMNRLMAPITAVGKNKADIFAEKTYEVDPFLEISVYNNGLGHEGIESFVNEPKLDLLFEEMDNPKMKIEIRKRARELAIPVVMIADNGDGVLVDIERYDLDQNTELFNGRLSDIDLDKVSDQMSFPEKLHLIAEMAGLREATPRMQSSILDVGRSLNTWPQLGTAAITAGVVGTFIARQILLGADVPSGRYSIGFEETFINGYTGEQAVRERREHTDMVMSAFESMRQAFSKRD